MTRKYSITAIKTGAEYPHYAPALGLGWQFVLKYEGKSDRFFSCHKMAKVFAKRLAAMVVT